VLSLARILGAGSVMYAAASGGMALLGMGTDTIERLLIVAVVGGISLAAYLGVAILLRTEELNAALTLLRQRTTKSER
jgi:putative peptidoglycan lipid II flippase